MFAFVLQERNMHYYIACKKMLNFPALVDQYIDKKNPGAQRRAPGKI
jgi:hypothetical protein